MSLSITTDYAITSSEERNLVVPKGTITSKSMLNNNSLTGFLWVGKVVVEDVSCLTVRMCDDSA